MGTEKRERQKANRALKQQQLEKQASRRSTTRWILIGVGAVVGVFLLAWIASNFVGEDDPTPVQPAITVPAETLPAETVPAETVPAETTPAETTPADGTEG